MFVPARDNDHIGVCVDWKAAQHLGNISDNDLDRERETLQAGVVRAIVQYHDAKAERVNHLRENAADMTRAGNEPPWAAVPARCGIIRSLRRPPSMPAGPAGGAKDQRGRLAFDQLPHRRREGVAVGAGLQDGDRDLHRTAADHAVVVTKIVV